MQLADYLTRENISDAEFATSIGVTRQTVHRYRNGERIPDQAAMAKIFDVTGGAVTPNDFFHINDPAPVPNNTAA